MLHTVTLSLLCCVASARVEAAAAGGCPGHHALLTLSLLLLQQQQQQLWLLQQLGLFAVMILMADYFAPTDTFGACCCNNSQVGNSRFCLLLQEFAQVPVHPLTLSAPLMQQQYSSRCCLLLRSWC